MIQLIVIAVIVFAAIGSNVVSFGVGMNAGKASERALEAEGRKKLNADLAIYKKVVSGEMKASEVRFENLSDEIKALVLATKEPEPQTVDCPALVPVVQPNAPEGKLPEAKTEVPLRKVVIQKWIGDYDPALRAKLNQINVGAPK